MRESPFLGNVDEFHASGRTDHRVVYLHEGLQGPHEIVLDREDGGDEHCQDDWISRLPAQDADDVENDHENKGKDVDFDSEPSGDAASHVRGLDLIIQQLVAPLYELVDLVEGTDRACAGDGLAKVAQHR